nr:SIS domain-containing protein [Candidatus Cloacimonadota bacterium]
MNVLNNHNKLSQLDKDNMYHKIIHLPEQILLTYQNAKLYLPDILADKQKIQRLIICGMGGSAISADIAKAAFGKDIPIEVVKGYELPYCDRDTLVITISYSGNTEETLSCLQEAMTKTNLIAAITAGGKMKQLVENKFAWVEMEAGFPPRAAIAGLFISLLKLLEAMEIIPSQAALVKKIAAHLI